MRQILLDHLFRHLAYAQKYPLAQKCRPQYRLRKCGYSSNSLLDVRPLIRLMISLGAMYMIEQGPFIGFVQIIVYTGAIMILFLFVLMLVGRDSSDSLVETLRGQRWAALLAGIASSKLSNVLVAIRGNASGARFTKFVKG